MYYALYRKYRPLSFEDVIGQEAITTTLRRQVETGQISHAYLFTGTRGTGKTTCAKILSRAVNCLQPKNGNPCNECAICKGLLDGTLYDVEEIDAASNNGVENIRQIREEVVYTPTAAKYKVYIIDEVHMLSAGAFNALLKTLEEPPAHAIFILATTEIHKVPATILSRCQRFDFLRLSKKELMGQFRRVLAQEGKSLDERSLDLVAELADGSSRDGLSILDKVIDLTCYEEVENVLGVIPRQQIYGILTAASEQDTDLLYRTVEKMYNASADLGRLCTDLMNTVKDILIFRSAKDPASILEKNESDTAALKELAKRYPTERLLYSLKVLQDTVALLPRSPDKRADTEVCLLRIAHPELQPDPEALTARIALLEEKIKRLGELPPRSATEPVRPAAEPAKKVEKQAPAKAPMPQFEDPFANPSVASAGKYSEPEEFAPPQRQIPKPEPKRPQISPERVQKQAFAPTEETFVDGWQPLDAWRDIAHTVSREDRILGYLLLETPAVYSGRNIIVIAEDEQDYKDIKTAQSLQLIQAALKENRKDGYSVRIEHCAPDKYIPNATIDHLKKENLFDFGEDDIPEYDE